MPPAACASSHPPQGRGASQGYDNAVALPAASDAEELAKENAKSAAASKGGWRQGRLDMAAVHRNSSAVVSAEQLNFSTDWHEEPAMESAAQ